MPRGGFNGLNMAGIVQNKYLKNIFFGSWPKKFLLPGGGWAVGRGSLAHGPLAPLAVAGLPDADAGDGVEEVPAADGASSLSFCSSRAPR